jgi:ABC transporter substrate binding protein
VAVFVTRPQLHTARELGDTLLGLAQQAHDPALAVLAHYARGWTWLCLGALPMARQHLEVGIARYTPDQRRAPVFRMGQDPGVACRANAALTLWLLGYPEQAQAHLHEALALPHELSHPFSLAWVRCRAAMVSQCSRDVPAAHAQPSPTIPRIGIAGRTPGSAASFLQAVRDLGYREGQTIAIESRWTEGQLDRLPDLAAELVRIQPDLLVAISRRVALAAKAATTTIPIVFLQVNDPVGGLVASLAHPGRNVTGVSLQGLDLRGSPCWRARLRRCQSRRDR